MNQGIHPFPSYQTNQSPNSGLLSLREFDASGNYTIPPSTKYLYIFARGGGGGGGSGRRAASAANAAGGGGGSGGAWILDLFPVEVFGGVGTTLSIIIGAGGDGGAARTVDGTDGAGGSFGGTTQIYSLQRNSFPVVCGGGSIGGGGGAAAGGSAGGANNSYVFRNLLSVNAGSAGSTSTPTAITITNAFVNSPGGCGGGGYTVASGAAAGGGVTYATAAATGVFNPQLVKGASLNLGGAVRGNGVNILNRFGTFFSPHISAGGGGGSATVGSGAGNGGAGFRGGGGGGGGGAITGANSGAGGRGGNGYVAIAAIS